MAKKRIKISLGLLGGLCLLFGGIAVQSATFKEVKEVPVKGQINLVDLASDYCLPCKMMAPILTKVEKNYQGKVAVLNIDVEKFPEQVKRFGIRVIPTQLFFDSKGKEVYRHEGFLSEKEIIAQFKKMGVD
jgi:thioredoxin 1